MMRPALALLALLAAGAAVPAQDTFIYAFNQAGLVSANGYPLEDLPNGGGSGKDQLWRSLAVQGPDRWMLRGDGRIEVNGEELTNLTGGSGWHRIVLLDGEGDYLALAKNGRLWGPAGELAGNAPGNASFTDLATDGVTSFALRENGSVHRVPDPQPLLKFTASSSGGKGPATTWARLFIHPLDGRLWALRQDGRLVSADVPLVAADPLDGGTLEAALPFDEDAVSIADQLYYDFALDAQGDWVVLRADGKVFTAAQGNTAVVNFPGGPSGGSSQVYISVLPTDDDTLALRQDGGLYSVTLNEKLLDLKGSAYLRLVAGTEFPDLENAKNTAPMGTSTSLVAPEGADIELTVLAVDRDLPSEELVVDLAEGTLLPAGAVWVPETRTLSWPDAGPPGKFKFQVTISDSIAKPVKTTQTITIKALDLNDAKNAKPAIAAVSNAVALVGVPFELPVLAYDLDGPLPALSLDPGAEVPDTAGFDSGTGLLTWTLPLLSDVGTTGFKLLATDGTVTVKRTMKVKVLTSLLGF